MTCLHIAAAILGILAVFCYGVSFGLWLRRNYQPPQPPNTDPVKEIPFYTCDNRYRHY